MTATGPEFSLIVPALDEEAQLGETLRRARAALGPGAEFIVVDGGSRDRTREVAAGAGAAVADAAGRGAQLALGARMARGRVLVFLHADTWLPEGAGEAVRGAVSRGAGAGCFRFDVQPTGQTLRYRLLAAGVNWRTRAFRTATGDQAIFATRAAYEGCGGFAEQPLFEDLAFVRSVRRVARFEPLSLRVRTSPRRWERGFARTVLGHWLLRVGFALGCSPSRLSRLYPRA